MRLRVSSIDPTLTKVKLQDIFEEYGEIQSLKSFRLPDGSGNLALVLIEMKREKEAFQAIKDLNGKCFGDTSLKVELSNDTIKSQHRKPVAPLPLDDEEDPGPDIDDEEDDMDEEDEEVEEVPLDDDMSEEY